MIRYLIELRVDNDQAAVITKEMAMSVDKNTTLSEIVHEIRLAEMENNGQ